jgi:drug/metabolite transporter (DMT)-like permease
VRPLILQQFLFAMHAPRAGRNAMPISVYFQALFATLLWGTAIPVAKYAFNNYHVPAIAFAGLRFTLAGLLLLATAFIFRNTDAPDHPEEKTHWPRVLLIGLLSTAIFYGLFFAGLSRTSAVSAAVLDGVGPIFSSILAHFVLHNDKLSRQKIAAILLAFCGLVVVTFSRYTGGSGSVSTIGCLMIIIGLLVNSCGTMLVVTYRGSLSLLRLTGCQMCFGGTLLLTVSALVEQRWDWIPRLDFRFLAAWLWLSVVSATAFRIWYNLVRKYKLTSLSVFSFFTCIWGALLSVVALGERFTPQLIVGFIMVAAGVAMNNAGRQSHVREVAPQPVES